MQRRAERHRGIGELPHVAIDEHDIPALAQRQRGLGLVLERGEVALAQRRRSRQRLQSLDLADDLTVDGRRQSAGLAHQVVESAADLHAGDAKPRVGAEQQQRRNDRASEHDLQMPQWARLAEHGHRSDPQDDPPGDAKLPNDGRQRGRFD